LMLFSNKGIINKKKTWSIYTIIAVMSLD
jgi:hypothetical protein